ncbi:Calcium-dependent protein kinase 3 [Platanthera zijinensis]|uniref:Calcium-dependent protein kinase 3 n=1 Tax=Platanthera zijinensis TaxID=2320716 RepID=A0AAP0BCZ2_9ASPA
MMYSRDLVSPIEGFIILFQLRPPSSWGNCSGQPSSHPDPPPASGLTVKPASSAVAVKPAASSMPPPPPPEKVAGVIGRVLGRPMDDVRHTYSFGRELGRGQFGVTYLVTHRKTARDPRLQVDRHEEAREPR